MLPDIPCLLMCAFALVSNNIATFGCMLPTCGASGHTARSRRMQTVIAASILFFQTAASMTNIAGTSLALSGVLLYSLAKRTIKTEPDMESVRI